MIDAIGSGHGVTSGTQGNVPDLIYQECFFLLTRQIIQGVQTILFGFIK
jgi:hypothetical protein